MLGACAQAGPENAQGPGPDAAVTGPDSAPTPTIDASPFPSPVDAAVPGAPDATPLPGPVDAAVPPPPPIDAGSGGFCSANPDCPNPAECCFVALCVPGTGVGDLCFPD